MRCHAPILAMDEPRPGNRPGLTARADPPAHCARPGSDFGSQPPRDRAGQPAPGANRGPANRSGYDQGWAVRAAQAAPGDARIGTVAPLPPLPEATVPTGPATIVGGRSVSLEAALYGAVTSNPDLVALRNSNIASAEAVEVARRFPTTLNPTLWVDYPPHGPGGVPGVTLRHGRMAGPHIDHKDALMYFSLRQPIELGHQTTPPPRDRQGRAEPAAVDRRAGGAAGAGADVSLLPDRRLPPREAAGGRTSSPTSTSSLFQSLRSRLEANQVRPGRRVARGRGGERGDPPARRGRPAGLRRRPGRPPQPGRPARDRRARPSRSASSPARATSPRSTTRR